MLPNRNSGRTTLKGAVGLFVLIGCSLITGAQTQSAAPETKTSEIRFKSHDGYDMFGKLVLPVSAGNHPVVIYVQDAEGTTVDMKRRKPGGGFFYYFDV